VEVGYLLDTNVLVYHVAGDPAATGFLDQTIIDRSFGLSILSVIEFLGWHGHSDETFAECKALIGLATVFTVDGDVADRAIALRRVKKIKLADAIIAATALANRLSLVTRNTRDFRGINELNLVNPFE
jgi:predicted nucleic acid-binding protein